MQGRLGDTVAAIATARGTAALAIVRVSGPEATTIANRCFSGADLTAFPSHTVHFGYTTDADGEVIDQVVATVFRAPSSSTGEDVVEISCHGGDLAPASILARLIQCGARMAAPGEFTQRAFLNGKLDLAQAEAVADVIHAASSTARRISMSHLRGRYSALLANLREELLELAAYVELELDFSEEDVAFADRDRLKQLIQDGRGLLRRLLASYRTGAMLRDGVRVVIGGRPNAGKSTLLNALVGYDRAIVSEHPGTTRDEVEAEAEIGGIRFRFTDTAGLRETADVVEAEGVARARRSITTADVLVYVYDLAEGLDEAERHMLADTRRERPDLTILIVGNKRDLSPRAGLDDSDLPGTHVRVSAKTAVDNEAELDEVVRKLLDVAGNDPASIDASAVVMNERHRSHLQRALDALDAAERGLAEGVTGDTLALDLRAALDEIGAITGAVTTEDVLDQIFSRFCIGK